MYINCLSALLYYYMNTEQYTFFFNTINILNDDPPSEI